MQWYVPETNGFRTDITKKASEVSWSVFFQSCEYRHASFNANFIAQPWFKEQLIFKTLSSHFNSYCEFHTANRRGSSFFIFIILLKALTALKCNKMLFDVKCNVLWKRKSFFSFETEVPFETEVYNSKIYRIIWGECN